MADGKPLRAGPLQSSLMIELHSDYALRLWMGRTSEDKNGNPQVGIPSMAQMIKRTGMLAQGAAADNPYADTVLYELEMMIEKSSSGIQTLLSQLSKKTDNQPKKIAITEAASSALLNLGIYSYSPLAYRLSPLASRLSAIGYRLSAIGYRLSAIGYRLSAIGVSGYWWVTINWPSRHCKLITMV